MAQSAAGGHAVPFKAGALGTIEAALLFQLLRREGRVMIADARQLLESERLPASAEPGKLGWGSLLVTVVRIALMGNLPFSRASKRARSAEAGARPDERARARERRDADGSGSAAEPPRSDP